MAERIELPETLRGTAEEQLKQLYIRSMDNDENIGEMVEQIVETYKRNEV